MRALAVLSTVIVLFVSACSSMTSGTSGPTVPAPPAVFFLKDSADIAASDGADVISRTVAKAKTGDVASIQVTGYADIYGPVNYNTILAQRRADAVKAALVAGGVTKPITAHGASPEEHFDAGMSGDQGIADRRATIKLIPTS